MMSTEMTDQQLSEAIKEQNRWLKQAEKDEREARKHKQSPKQAAYLFFLKHAGFSYDPKTETPKQGRSRCARELAKAERDAAQLGYTFEWTDDWMVGNHFQEYGECYKDGEPDTCETCQCLDADGNVLASLGCIDDASREYRRVVEAELASEALAGQ